MSLPYRFLLTTLIALAALLGSSSIDVATAEQAGLTAGQWETCAREFGSASTNLAPCTAQDVQWAAEHSGESQAQVNQTVSAFTRESTSRRPTTPSAPAGVMQKLEAHTASLAGASPSRPGHPGSGTNTAPQSTQKTSKASAKDKAISTPPSIPVSAVGGSAQPIATQSGGNNPNDSLVNNDVMNLTDPACGMSGITVTQLSRCLRTGDPSVPDPLGNYQMDIHVKTGITHPENDAISVLESVMNVVWLMLLYILKGALTLLGWAFSLSPFTSSATLGTVQTKLESVYRNLDNVWIDSVFVAIGGYGLYLGFVRRKQSEAIGHLGASVGAILLAMAIIHAPRTFIGKPAGFVNSFAQDAISSANLAAQNQTGTVPASKLAGLTGDLFESFADGPFCALETNDVGWCMSSPTSTEMKVIHIAVVNDTAYEKQAKAIAVDVASRLPASQQISAYKAVYGTLTSTWKPATRAALFLRYPPGSTPREILYAYYSGELVEDKSPMGEFIHDTLANQKALEGTPAAINITLGTSMGNALAQVIFKHGIGLVTSIFKTVENAVVAPYGGVRGSSKEIKPVAPNKVAIQGSGGLVQRCLVLTLTVLAFIGVLLVLVWLALHLVSQALLGFVLLLATPIMMLSPAFGIAGRKAFAGWIKTLFGAIASKAFYAAFLGVFVLALTALQQVSTAALGSSAHAGSTAAGMLEPEGTSGGGWGVPWVMQCLLCWAVFFKRNKIVGFFSIDPASHQQSGSGSMAAMRVLGAAYAANRLGSAAFGAASGAIKRPFNAYRTRSLERKMGREDATRDLADEELGQQELDVAGRSHEHNKERAGTYAKALERTDQRLDRLKQNPEYRKYRDWIQSLRTNRKIPSSETGWGSAPKFEGSKAELLRGGRMAKEVAKLEGGRNRLQERRNQTQRLVDQGESNLRQHGQLLTPGEIADRVEARRAGLASMRSNPNAWKRPENLELAGKHTTPQQLRALEANAQSTNTATSNKAKTQLKSIENEVTARMRTSERLLEGVPNGNRFDRNVAPSAPKTAAKELRSHGMKNDLRERARQRRRELKHQRYTRKRLYRR